MRRSKASRRVPIVTGLFIAPVLAVVVAAGPAAASPVAPLDIILNTDWTSAGVSGVGAAASGGGTGVITLSGVSGTVDRAYLSWHGIGPQSPAGPYVNPTVVVNGTPVTGSSMGESGSNCWGEVPRTSRTYVADVTALVTGNGSYTVTGLGAGGDTNGAHLVVTFHDTNPANNRDLYLSYGNDSNGIINDQYPGEDNAWSADVMGLNYRGGQAKAQLAVADGQNFSDGAVTFSSTGGPVTFADTTTRFEGVTLPNAGHGRPAGGNGALYDLHTFDITPAFTGPGSVDLHVGAPVEQDCLSLTMLAVDLPAPTVSIASVSKLEGTGTSSGGKLTKFQFKVSLSAKLLFPVTVTVATSDGFATSPHDYKAKTQTLTIPPGVRTKVFVVNVVPDSLVEVTEAFHASITSASIYIGNGFVDGEILNDDT